MREVKNDAIALLEHVKEQYDYILPQARETLTEAEALDLDQHAGILDTTFQTARAKQVKSEQRNLSRPKWTLGSNSTGQPKWTLGAFSLRAFRAV